MSNSEFRIRAQDRVVPLSGSTNPSQTMAKLLQALAESFESMFWLNYNRSGPWRDSFL